MTLKSPFSFLFQPTDLSIPSLSAQFAQFNNPPQNVANVNVVPFVGELCVVIVTTTNNVDMPGGTLEPDEHYLEAAKREMLEEAGAKLLNFQVLGGWKCHSSAEKPYRAHMPHPDFYRLVGFGDVEIIGAPQIPDDGTGEQVISVNVITVEEAVGRFREVGRPDLADLYQLAASVRASG
jgi:8-oxo-dGTP diphosphatase